MVGLGGKLVLEEHYFVRLVNGEKKASKKLNGYVFTSVFPPY